MDKEIGETLAVLMYTERPEVKERLLEYSQTYSEVKRKRLLESLRRRAPNAKMEVVKIGESFNKLRSRQKVEEKRFDLGLGQGYKVYN